MALTYIFQIVLFGPVLAIATRYEHAESQAQEETPPTGWRAVVDNCSKNVLRLYCRLIGHRAFTVSIVLLTCVYWYFGAVGLMNMQTRLDAVKILPKNSPLQRPNHILTNIGMFFFVVRETRVIFSLE